MRPAQPVCGKELQNDLNDYAARGDGAAGAPAKAPHAAPRRPGAFVAGAPDHPARPPGSWRLSASSRSRSVCRPALPRSCAAPCPAPPSACAPIWTPCRSRSAPERNFPPAFPASCTPADMISIWPPCSAQPACLQRGGSSWPGTSCSCSSPPRRPQRAPCRCWSRACFAAFRWRACWRCTSGPVCTGAARHPVRRDPLRRGQL